MRFLRWFFYNDVVAFLPFREDARRVKSNVRVIKEIDMKCLCGSGKFSQNCHGKEHTKESLRKYLKYDVLAIDKNGQVGIHKSYNSLGFSKQTYKCKLQYLKPMTPAGIIIYPILITRKGKALRPATIDGLHFDKSGGTVIQYIQCMITPLSRAVIKFDASNIKQLKNGYIETECHIECDGNPFESLFSIDVENGLLKLYHHTTKENSKLIKSSAKLLFSKWNLQGTDELNNHHHIYFTNLETIQDIYDLLEIGMADKGAKTKLCTDDGKNIEEFEVYREQSNNRDATLTLWVDPEILSPQPLILHAPGQYINAEFSWWEVFHNAIYRVPIKPGSFLPITHITNDEYYLEPNENLSTVNGFIAGHGMNIDSMKRVLSELPIEMLKTDETINNADIGMPDNLWIKTWKKNLSSISFNILKGIEIKNPTNKAV